MLEYDKDDNSPGQFKRRRRPMSAAARIAAATLAKFQDAASSSASSSSSSGGSDTDLPSGDALKKLSCPGQGGAISARGLDDDEMAEDRVFLRELALEGRAERAGRDVEFHDADSGMGGNVDPRRRPGDPFLDSGVEDVDPAEEVDPDELGAPLADFTAVGVAALLGFTPSAAVVAGTTRTLLPQDECAVSTSGERPMTARRTAAAAAAADAERATFLRQVTKAELVIDSRLQSLRALGDLIPNVHELRFRHSARSHLSSFRDFGTTAFRSLRVLWVCNCALASLSGVQHLHQLVELYASFNAITSLDPVADLLNLEVLDVEANQIALPSPPILDVADEADADPAATGAVDTPAVMRGRVRDALYGVANLTELRTLTLSGNPLTFEVLRWEQAALEQREARARGRLSDGVGSAAAGSGMSPPTLRQMVFAAVPSLEILDDAEADAHDRLQQQHQEPDEKATQQSSHALRGPRALLAAASSGTASGPPTPPPPASGQTSPPLVPSSSPQRHNAASDDGVSLRPPTAAARVADAQARLLALEEEFLVLRASVAKRPQDFSDTAAAAAASGGANFFAPSAAAGAGVPPRPFSAMGPHGAVSTSRIGGGVSRPSARVGAAAATASDTTSDPQALWAFRPTTASSFIFDAVASRPFTKYAGLSAVQTDRHAAEGRIGARVGGFDALERARAENAKSLRNNPSASSVVDGGENGARQRPSTARVTRSVEFSMPGAAATTTMRVPGTARVGDDRADQATHAAASPGVATHAAPPKPVAAASAAGASSSSVSNLSRAPIASPPVAPAASTSSSTAPSGHTALPPPPPPPPPVASAALKPRLRAPLAVAAPSPLTSAGPTPTATLAGSTSGGTGALRRPQAALRPLAAASPANSNSSTVMSAPVTSLAYGAPSSNSLGRSVGAASSVGGSGLRPPSSGLRQLLPTRAAPSRPTTGTLTALDGGAEHTPHRRLGGGRAAGSRSASSSSSSGESVSSVESSPPRPRDAAAVAAPPPAARDEATRRTNSPSSSDADSSPTSSRRASRSSSGSSLTESSLDASPLQARYAGGRRDISGAVGLPAAATIAEALNPADVRPASAIGAAMAAMAAVPSLVLKNPVASTSAAAAAPGAPIRQPPTAADEDLVTASPVGQDLFQHLRVDDGLLPELPSDLLGGVSSEADVLTCDNDAAADDSDAVTPGRTAGTTSVSDMGSSSPAWRERAERIQALLRAMPQVPAPMPRTSATSAAALAGPTEEGDDSSGVDTPSPVTLTPVESGPREIGNSSVKVD